MRHVAKIEPNISPIAHPHVRPRHSPSETYRSMEIEQEKGDGPRAPEVGAGGSFVGPVGGGCLRDNCFTFGRGRGIGFGHALMRSAGHG